MDKNVEFVIEKKVERTIENLKKNNMNAYFVNDEKEALNKISEIIVEGNTVSVGGSMTLEDAGIIDFLKNGNYNFLYRYDEGLTKEDIKKLLKNSLLVDVYLTSSNAITEQGELYNVDAYGNRVAAMIYGPDKVIVVVGTNKIVRDLDAAIMRNREIAAPANAKRLSKNTPCAKVGYCMDCESLDRICNDYVVIKKQFDPSRIHVLIIDKEFGL